METCKKFEDIDNIYDLDSAMIDFANKEGKPVTTCFNRRMLTAEPGMKAGDIVQSLKSQIAAGDERYRNSPQAKEDARLREEHEKVCMAEEASGFKPFALKPERAQDWEWTIKHSFGGEATIFRFVSRWISIMEQKMADGKALKDIIDDSAHEADIAQIDRMCYAGKFVSRYWIHSEEFDRWNTIVD